MGRCRGSLNVSTHCLLPLQLAFYHTLSHSTQGAWSFLDECYPFWNLCFLCPVLATPLASRVLSRGSYKAPAPPGLQDCPKQYWRAKDCLGAPSDKNPDKARTQRTHRPAPPRASHKQPLGPGPHRPPLSPFCLSYVCPPVHLKATLWILSAHSLDPFWPF